MKVIEFLKQERARLLDAHNDKSIIEQYNKAIEELEALTITTAVFPIFRESKLSKGLKVCFISKDTFIALGEGSSELAEPIISRGTYVPNSKPYDNFDVWKECEISYPVYFKEYTDNGLIVCFIGKTEGTVIYKGSSSWNIGEYADNFISCHSDCWKDIYTLPQATTHQPTQSKFKVGDCVEHPEAEHPWRITQNSLDKLDNTKLKLWIPKPGEWCWVYNVTIELPYLRRVIRVEDNYKNRFSDYEFTKAVRVSRGDTTGEVGYRFCEPFIGTFPTNVKEY